MSRLNPDSSQLRRVSRQVHARNAEELELEVHQIRRELAYARWWISSSRQKGQRHVFNVPTGGRVARTRWEAGCGLCELSFKSADPKQNGAEPYRHGWNRPLEQSDAAGPSKLAIVMRREAAADALRQETLERLQFIWEPAQIAGVGLLEVVGDCSSNICYECLPIRRLDKDSLALDEATAPETSTTVMAVGRTRLPVD